jgi:hypothetical protein
MNEEDLADWGLLRKKIGVISYLHSCKIGTKLGESGSFGSAVEREE